MPNKNRFEVRVRALNQTTAAIDVNLWDANGKRDEIHITCPAFDAVDIFMKMERDYKERGYHVVLAKYEPFSTTVRQMIGMPPLQPNKEETA